jgi:hypothetical protein
MRSREVVNAQARFHELWAEWQRSSPGIQEALNGISQLMNQASFPREAGLRGIARVLPPASAYSAPTTLKSWLTKTWCGQFTPIMWTLYSPSLSSTTRLTVPPG